MATPFALLGSITLGSNSSTIDLSGFATKKYLLVEFSMIGPSGGTDMEIRFNGDSGNNYAGRYSQNGAAETTVTSVSFTECDASSSPGTGYIRMFIINISSSEKLVISHATKSNTAGAANVPTRTEFVGKWANTSNQINQITVVNTTATTYGIGSTLTVYGSD